MKFARATNSIGGAWGAPMVLDSADDVGSSASMAVVNGNPAVAYLDETNGDLNFIRATNSSGSN